LKLSIRILIISVIIAVLTINVFFGLLGAILNLSLFNPSFYDRFFERHHFYDILRQWILHRIGSELPHGREGLPYIEKGLTATWIRQEFIRISKQFFDFVNNRTDELPVLRMYRFKDAVMEHMGVFGEFDKREEILDYWLGPLPLNVRLQDVTSVDFLWSIRRVAMYIRWIMYGASIIVFILIILLLIITKSQWEAILWFASAITAAAALILGITTQALWFINRVDILDRWRVETVSYGFQPNSVHALFESFSNAIAYQFVIVSIIIAAVSFLVICYVPVKTELNLQFTTFSSGENTPNEIS